MAIIRDNALKRASGQTEESFLDDVVNYIVSLSPQITCDTTAAIQFADSSNTPTFNFSFNGKCDFRLKRANPLTMTNVNYVFSTIVRGAENNQHSFNFANSQYYQRFVSIISDDFILLYYGWGGSTSVNLTWSMGLVKTEDAYYAGYSYSNNLINSGTFCDVDTGIAANFPALINYTAPAGTLIYSELHPIKGGGDILLGYIRGLYSCSTVTNFTSIGLDIGKNFFAIGTHSMVEISQ